MVRVIAGLVLASGFALGSDSSYQNMKNPLLGKCLIEGTYNKNADTYAVKLQSCSSSATQLLKYQGGKLVNDEGYCVVAPNAYAGAPLVLGDCGSQYSKWTKQPGKLWRNSKTGLCMDANIKTGLMIQSQCSEYYVNTQQYILVPAKNGPPPYTCGVWGKTYKCPTGYQLASNKVSTTCVGGYGGSCLATCCVASTQTCKQWGIKNGCPYGQTLVSGTCGGAYAKDCKTVCCKSPPSPTTCGAWYKQGYNCGYLSPKPANTQCGSGYGGKGSCTKSLCCAAPRRATCGDYFNEGFSCSYGQTRKPANTQCKSTSVDSCSKAICCSAPAKPATCGAWFVHGYGCNYGQSKKPATTVCKSPDVASCSKAICCGTAPKPATCGDWIDVGFGCSRGQVNKPATTQCKTADPSSCNKLTCCAATPKPATCGQWFNSGFGCSHGQAQLDDSTKCKSESIASCTKATCCVAAPAATPPPANDETTTSTADATPTETATEPETPKPSGDSECAADWARSMIPVEDNPDDQSALTMACQNELNDESASVPDNWASITCDESAPDKDENSCVKTCCVPSA